MFNEFDMVYLFALWWPTFWHDNIYQSWYVILRSMPDKLEWRRQQLFRHGGPIIADVMGIFQLGIIRRKKILS